MPGLQISKNFFKDFKSYYDKKLEIYGPIGTKKSFDYMFKAFSFNLDFEYVIHDIEDTKIKLKEMIVISKPLEHGLPCLGYSFVENDKRRIKPLEIKKLGIPEGPLLGELQNNKPINWKGEKILPKNTTYIVKGKKVSIVLDTQINKNAYFLAKDADLLICEATYTSDLEEKAQEYKHLTAKQAAQLASQSNVKKLILTHVSQRHKTPELILEDAKDVFENVVVAYDFMKLKI